MHAGGPLIDQLRGLHENARDSIEHAILNHREDIGQLLQLDSDLQVWEKKLLGNPEVAQVSSARRDLAFAVYAAAIALYPQAYAGLRVFLELSFAAVHFSVYELERRKWLADRGDFSWSKALDEYSGILSRDFIIEFNPEAVEDAARYAGLAARCYRHCSQFVHGKAAVTSSLPTKLAYSEPVLADWIRTARDAAQSVLFLFYCRYGRELDLHESDLAATLEHSFAHIIAVRKDLGLPVDSEGGRK
jgi:hypothetical protein